MRLMHCFVKYVSGCRCQWDKPPVSCILGLPIEKDLFVSRSAILARCRVFLLLSTQVFVLHWSKYRNYTNPRWPSDARYSWPHDSSFNETSFGICTYTYNCKCIWQSNGMYMNACSEKGLQVEKGRSKWKNIFIIYIFSLCSSVHSLWDKTKRQTTSVFIPHSSRLHVRKYNAQTRWNMIYKSICFLRYIGHA